MAKYRVQRYASDGSEGGPGDGEVLGEYDTLAEARRRVRELLGVRALRAERRWSPPSPAVEAYHDLPASAPGSYGCGGVQIIDLTEEQSEAEWRAGEERRALAAADYDVC